MDFDQRLIQTLLEARRRGVDPWGQAYAMRYDPSLGAYVGRQEDPMRDVEHYLYARDTASRGPLGFAQMALGVPIHSAKKAFGFGRGDTGISELLRGWQGAGHGLLDWWQRP